MRVFANHVSNKGFICKETTTTQQQKTTNLIKKWEYDLNSFPKKTSKWPASTWKDA